MTDNSPDIVHERDAGPLRNFRLLIVEDFEFVADIIAKVLKKFGVKDVDIAHNAIEAREFLTKENGEYAPRPYDIVISDWLMPEEDGVSLIKWIRSKQDFEKICFLPIIFMTGYMTKDVAAKARDIGANEIMVKPISSYILAARILKLINNPRPFVKTKDFFGPDRRRKKVPFRGADKRKLDQKELKHVFEQTY